MRFNKIEILILLLALSLVSGCAGKKPALKSEALTPVSTVAVQFKQIGINKTFSGKVNSENEVSIGSKSPGKVENVYYDVGDSVSTGSVLFSLDKTNVLNTIRLLEIQLQSSKSLIDSAKIGLESASGSQSESSITQSKTSLEGTRINYEDAKENLADMKTLYEKGAISKEQYEKSKLAFEQAQLAYNAVQKTHSLLIDKIINQNVSLAQNQLNQARASENAIKAQLDDARKLLDDLDIKSPINGVVAANSAKRGELVSAGIPVFIVSDVNKLSVKISVSENLINSIKVGQKTRVLIKTAKDEPVEGEVANIGPVASNDTLTYPVEILIKDKNEAIKPGMFAEVIFEIEKRDNAIVVPRKSIEVDGDNRFIYVVEPDSTVKRLPILTGIDNGDEIEIKEGLTEAQQIIVKGKEYVKDGQKVNIVNN